MKKFLLSLLLFTAPLLFGEGFAPGTLVKTSDGYTAIENVTVGQQILSYNLEENCFTLNTVKENFNYSESRAVLIELYNQEDLICSLNQKFYLSTLGKWIEAEELLTDHNLKRLFENEYGVMSIACVDEPHEMHDVTLEPDHNFFVTKSDILAHNIAAVIPLVTVSAEGITLLGGVGVGGAAIMLGKKTIYRAIKNFLETFNGERINKDAIDQTLKQFNGDLLSDLSNFIPDISVEIYQTTFVNEDITTTGRAPGMPTEKDGYVPPKKWDGKKVKHPDTDQCGWPDKKGRVWIPSGEKGHGGPHWDVVSPDGGYKNILPGGRER